MNQWTIRRDAQGYAAAIELNGITVLHLIPGTERNENHAETVVAILNTVLDQLDLFSLPIVEVVA